VVDFLPVVLLKLGSFGEKLFQFSEGYISVAVVDSRGIDGVKKRIDAPPHRTFTLHRLQ